MRKKLGLTFRLPNSNFKKFHSFKAKGMITHQYGPSNKFKSNFNYHYYVIINEIYNLDAVQIEACKKFSQKILKKKGQFIAHVYPNLAITKKPSETRMGKGKSSRISNWLCPVKPGKVLFELKAKTYKLAQQIFNGIRLKLPVKLALVELNF